MDEPETSYNSARKIKVLAFNGKKSKTKVDVRTTLDVQRVTVGDE